MALTPTAAGAIVAVGLTAMGIVWRQYFADLFKALRDDWKPGDTPVRNEGGGYEWPDGRITPDPEGKGPDLRKRPPGESTTPADTACPAPASRATRHR